MMGLGPNLLMQALSGKAQAEDTDLPPGIDPNKPHQLPATEPMRGNSWLDMLLRAFRDRGRPDAARAPQEEPTATPTIMPTATQTPEP